MWVWTRNSCFTFPISRKSNNILLCVIWQDTKYYRWNCATATLNQYINIYLHRECCKTSFILLLYFDHWKFNLTGVFLFFCSWWPAEEYLQRCYWESNEKHREISQLATYNARLNFHSDKTEKFKGKYSAKYLSWITRLKFFKLSFSEFISVQLQVADGLREVGLLLRYFSII